jgi:hypothetical protein
MKKFRAVVILIALGAGVLCVFKFKKSAPQNPTGVAVTNAVAVSPKNNSPAAAAPVSLAGVSAPPAAATGQMASIASTAPAAPTVTPGTPALGISSLPPLTVLDNARVAMHNYNGTFGENPVGTNPEITEALTGKNPKGINFITAESGLRVNGNGEMVDAWGTPFFFHQISGKEMEIRSAGQDRKMWTFDDLVTR